MYNPNVQSFGKTHFISLDIQTSVVQTVFNVEILYNSACQNVNFVSVYVCLYIVGVIIYSPILYKLNQFFFTSYLCSDIEFHENSGDKAIFYTDTGHSFDRLLLYGHEFSLTVFEVLAMSFVDLFVRDFLTAGIVTYFVSKAVSLVRYTAGRSNLAKKTLIDRRFLI